MKKIIFTLAILFTLSSCKKDNVNSTQCWKCYDQQNNFLQESCGENEQDAFNKSGSIEGVHDISKFRQRCHKE